MDIIVKSKPIEFKNLNPSTLTIQTPNTTRTKNIDCNEKIDVKGVSIAARSVGYVEP